LKKYLPLLLVLVFLGVGGYFVLSSNSDSSSNKIVDNNFKEKSHINNKKIDLEDFDKVRGCSRLPNFLYKAGVKRPIIDLSQEHYTGIAFYFDNGRKVIHKKQWEQFEHLGTYTIDRFGNIYLTPNPFISIRPTTFNLQKGIYKLDSKTGYLSRFMVIDEVSASAKNPYGLISVLYDCKDDTLWASSIDKTDYKGMKGRIYHIDINKKEIIDKYEGFDALTINWIYGKNKRYLVAGSAMENGVYLFELKDGKLQDPVKIFSLPNAQLRARKIRVVGKNRLKIEAIKFNYSLVAQTSKKQREVFDAIYDSKAKKWIVK